MENNIVYGYKVINIETVNFKFEQVTEEELNELLSKPDSSNFNMNIHLGIYKNESRIEIHLTSKLTRVSDHCELINHIGRTVYDFQNLEYFYNEAENHFEIPDAIVTELCGIAYAHSRTLLGIELRPTVYRDKYYLPITDPEIFIKNLNFDVN